MVFTATWPDTTATTARRANRCALSRYDLGGVTARGGVVVAGTDQLRLPVVKSCPTAPSLAVRHYAMISSSEEDRARLRTSVAATKKYPLE